MPTSTKNVLKNLGLPTILILGCVLLAHASPAFGQIDIGEGITTATSSFKTVLKTVFTIAALVIVIGGLLVTAWKFTQRDPHSFHFLVGAIAAAVICTIISGML
jgi:hypothetical protein